MRGLGVERKKVGWRGIGVEERDRWKSWVELLRMVRGVRKSSTFALSPSLEMVLRYSFIPIAHTFIIKALASISQRHTTNQPKSSIAGTAKDPNLHLIAATCNGDLRSAINSLQMLKTGLRLGGAKGKRLPTGRDENIAGIKKPVKGRGSKGGKGAKIDADEGVRAA